jgi:hypothetical protein
VTRSATAALELVLLWHKPAAQWRAYRATYTLCATTSAAEGQTVLELAVLFYF